MMMTTMAIMGREQDASVHERDRLRSGTREEPAENRHTVRRYEHFVCLQTPCQVSDVITSCDSVRVCLTGLVSCACLHAVCF